MAFYPDVNPGDKFTPSAAFENELRRIVNSRDGFNGIAKPLNQVQTLTVPVINVDTVTIEAGLPVSFTKATDSSTGGMYIDSGVVPAKRYTDGTKWGVVTDSIAPGEIGTCVITGVVKVKSSSDSQSLSPSASGFISGNSVPCIFSHAGSAVIVIGSGSGGSYNGYFTIKLRTLEDGTQKIVVCDGATYDAEKGTSGDSVAYVGGVYHAVETIEIPVPKKSTHVIAEFTPAERDDNGDVITESKVLVSTCDDLTSKEGFFAEIGQLRVEGTGLQVIQRHGTSAFSLFNNGTLFIDYYGRCNE